MSLHTEVASIRAELNVLSWFANIAHETVQIRSELEAAIAELEQLKKQASGAAGKPAAHAAPAVDNDPDAEAARKAVAQVAANDPALTSLVLNNNAKLTPELQGQLGDALAHNTALQTLELAHAGICNEGARRIAAGLGANKTLRALNLETNQIGAEGFKAISAALGANSTLAELKLANQAQMPSLQSEKELAAAVDANTALTNVSIALRDAPAREMLNKAVSRNKETLRKKKLADKSPSTSPASSPRAPAPAPAAAPKPAAAAPAPAPAAAPKPAAAPAPAPAAAPKPAPAPVPAAAPKPAAAPAPAPKPAAAPAAAPKPAPAPVAVAKPTPAAAPAPKSPTSTAAPAAAAKPAAPAAAPAGGKTYSLAELATRPAGLDFGKLESYLSDEEFKATFKMGREEFYKLPGWKQAAQKKEKKLF